MCLVSEAMCGSCVDLLGCCVVVTVVLRFVVECFAGLFVDSLVQFMLVEEVL